MISIMIKSAIVLAVAACIAGLLRRQSAALRHAIWTAGLIGALLAPLCSVALPTWQSGIVGRAEHFFKVFQSASPSSASVSIVNASASPLSSGSPQTSISGEPPIPTNHPQHHWTVTGILIAVWIAGAALGIFFMLFGALRLAWVAIRSEPVTDSVWLERTERVRQSLGFRRPVRLLQSQSSHFLGTWGILSPRVLLPFDADQWSDDRAWMVLGHELAHIQRHDWVVQVLAEAARAIYWFNPVFWLAYSRLRRESEQACDDSVIRMGAVGTQYAEELLELARTLRREDRFRSPILAMAQPSHLERRLVALLDPALNRLAATPWSVTVVALVAIGLTLPLAAVRGPDAVVATTPVVPVPPSISVPAVSPRIEASDAFKDTPKKELEKIAVPAAIVSPIEVQGDVQMPRIGPALAKLNVPSVAVPPFECKVTPSVQETKMVVAKSPLGSGPWHINDDRTIWTWDQPYIAGTAVNTMWMKPANVDLVISGRRLDGDSNPLKIQLAKDSTATYIATNLTFPNAGCWEVTASAGSSTLTFITRVESQ